MVDADVIGFISSKKKFKVKELADYLDVDWYKARNILLKLKTKGIVKKSKSEKGLWIFISESKKQHEKDVALKDKILNYLEGQDVPVRVSHIALVFRENNKYISRLLRELEKENKVRSTKRGYYIHANKIVYRVGSGEKPIYLSPLKVHHLTLEYRISKCSIDKPVRKITVSPYGIINQSQMTLDNLYRVDMGGKVAVIEVSKIWRNERTKWWEIDLYADLDSKLIPLHLQVGECKLLLKTRSGDKAMDFVEFERFMGWLLATFKIPKREWIVKEMDLNRDWYHIFEKNYGGFEEKRLHIAENLIYHEYTKRMSGEVVKRVELQYHDKESEITPEHITRVLKGNGDIIEEIEENNEKITKVLEEVKGSIEEGNREMSSGIVGLSESIMKVGEMIKEVAEGQKKIMESQSIVMKSLQTMLEDISQKKERELKAMEEMEQNRKEPEGYA